MSRAAPDFLAFLDGIRSVRSSTDGDKRSWCDALLASEDLRDAAERDDVAAARTCVASIARRLWPSSDAIPRSVSGQLGVLGVTVRW